MIKQISILLAVLMTTIIYSQCPAIAVPSTFTLTNCQTGNTITATSNYSANITSRWIGPGNMPIASVGTATSVVYLNYPGTYKVVFSDNSSNCVVVDSIQIVDVLQKPSFDLSITAFNLTCAAPIIMVNAFNGNTIPPGGPVSYTLLPPMNLTTSATTTLTTFSTYTISFCGDWEFMVCNNTNFCRSSYRFAIGCNTVIPMPLSVVGNSTVCYGSSVTYTSNGTNHLWSNGATTSTMNVIPSANTVYSLTGIDMNGCASSGTVAVTVNTTCTDVWPGDANSDGLVDNLDVFEIGLAMSAAGPSRSPGGNTYISQFANNWIGTVSTGKNRCHADCDGNGLVDQNDTLAIFNNFLIPHTFKESSSPSNNPDLSISANTVLSAGSWNKATISVGDNTNSVSQLLGLAFTLNYDASMIETDSLYLVYLPSFLNNNGQNVQFRKKFFSNGKMYGTSIRTTGTSVNGYGAIAELHFKLKAVLAENSVLNFSLAEVQKINAAGNLTALSAGNLSALIDANAVGFYKENKNKLSACFFPNPSSNEITLLSNSNEPVTYKLLTIGGQEVGQGSFISSIKIDLTTFSSGSYFIEFEQNGLKAYKKLVIAR